MDGMENVRFYFVLVSPIFNLNNCGARGGQGPPRALEPIIIIIINCGASTV